MKDAPLHSVPVEPLPQQMLQPVPTDVFLIIRKIVSRWNTTAKVVASHQDIEAAREDIALFRLHDPLHTFAIFVPYREEPDA